MATPPTVGWPSRSGDAILVFRRIQQLCKRVVVLAGLLSKRNGVKIMTDTEMIPSFLLNLRLDEGDLPIIVSCSIVGDITGFRGVVRRLKDCKALEQEFGSAGLAPERYRNVLSSFVAEAGRTRSFPIDLNEAQKLSVIQIDSPE